MKIIIHDKKIYNPHNFFSTTSTLFFILKPYKKECGSCASISNTMFFILKVSFSRVKEDKTKSRGHQKPKFHMVHHGFAVASSILLLLFLPLCVLIFIVSNV